MEHDSAVFWQIPTQLCTQTTPRVLLFDRDPMFCLLMERAAQKSGVILFGVSRLDEFSGLIEHQQFDLIVADELPRSVMEAARGSGRVIPKKGGAQGILDAAVSLKYFYSFD